MTHRPKLCENTSFLIFFLFLCFSSLFLRYRSVRRFACRFRSPFIPLSARVMNANAIQFGMNTNSRAARATRAPHWPPHSLVYLFSLSFAAPQVPGAVCVLARACFQPIFVGRLKSNWFSFIGYALLAPVRVLPTSSIAILIFGTIRMGNFIKSWMGLRMCVWVRRLQSLHATNEIHENTFGWRAKRFRN